ncbi:Fatty acid desaturase [Candidatus Burkholderia pumila]|uniref:Fatty acid desaturase n=1 Tax=Candidatus Burkholderia pumila TaxID=1090375 RepID=A0ABR5HKL4_9BURK|nr:Fatty acid desaturase [Candidatus Burkholderia pumila]
MQHWIVKQILDIRSRLRQESSNQAFSGAWNSVHWQRPGSLERSNGIGLCPLEKYCRRRPFVFGVGYPALASVRSFQEHRVAPAARQRTVINEAGWLWRLLFLNNNFHAVHHDLPGMPWFSLGDVYAARRIGYRASNGGFVVRGYGGLRHHAFACAVSPVHSSSIRRIAASLPLPTFWRRSATTMA